MLKGFEMARRRYVMRKKCAEDGCGEVTFFEYDTPADYAEGYKRYANWRCVRHTSPDEVLSARNATTEHVMTVQRREDLGKSFWDGRSGFIFGPGFKAFADDFPEGTRIVITARLELPASS